MKNIAHAAMIAGGRVGSRIVSGDLDDATSYLQEQVLGFCGCGDPEENLLFVLSGLEPWKQRNDADPNC